MNNNQAPRRTPRQRAIFGRRFSVVRQRWGQRWGAKFRKRMLDRSRYWRVRRRMAGHGDMTLGQGYLRVLLDDLRKAA